MGDEPHGGCDRLARLSVCDQTDEALLPCASQLLGLIRLGHRSLFTSAMALGDTGLGVSPDEHRAEPTVAITRSSPPTGLT